MVVNEADIHTFSVLTYTLNFPFRKKKLYLFIFLLFFFYKVDNRAFGDACQDRGPVALTAAQRLAMKLL